MSPTSVQQTTFAFVCPHCQHSTQVDIQYAGQSGQCVSCGKPITVPDAMTVELQSRGTVAPVRRPPWVGWGLVLGGVLSLGIAGTVSYFLLRPTLQRAVETSQLHSCQRQLETIGEALDAYHAEHGHFPPAVVYDAQGRPMHSWRVLLLPYLDLRLSGLYDLNEPWNSAKNIRLVSEVPEAFRCPADQGLNAGETNFLAVVGNNTVLRDVGPPPANEKPQGMKLTQISDFAHQTLVVIESENSAVPWSSPSDISIDALRAGLGSPNPNSPGSHHAAGVNALMLDGSVVCLPAETTGVELRSMSTVDGDEFIETLDAMGR